MKGGGFTITQTDRKPLIMFRVWPEASEREHCSLYYRVFVWPDQEQMRLALRDEGIRVSKKIQGFSRAYEAENEAGRLLPACGDLHFHRARLQLEPISHEVTHAACAYMRRRRYSFEPLYRAKERRRGHVSQNEEVFCYLVSNMMRQIERKIGGLIYQANWYAWIGRDGEIEGINKRAKRGAKKART